MYNNTLKILGLTKTLKMFINKNVSKFCMKGLYLQ